MRYPLVRIGLVALPFVLLAGVATTQPDDAVPRVATIADQIAAIDQLSDTLSTVPHGAAEGEPIAFIGHGAFFDQSGKQIVPTAEFVAEAQRWYREHLLAGLPAEKRESLEEFEHRLAMGSALDEQTQLIVGHRSLDWLLAETPTSQLDKRMIGKLNALKHRLEWKLPRRDDLEELRSLEAFELDSRTASLLQLPEHRLGQIAQRLVTTNSGQEYIDECVSHSVPIPPPIGVLDPAGVTGWRSLGFIPPADQFIVLTPAEVRVYEDGNGMCIALPRYTDGDLDTVFLDGVICLSSVTSKVCFWDNQMNGDDFEFDADDQIPIGVPDLAIDPDGRYQGGGAEIEFGPGGECSDCHAGENPYVVHPDSDLGGGIDFGDMAGSLGLPTFGPLRYDPIVGGTWYQNDLSHSPSLVPDACLACHTQSGPGGRFPHLSSDIGGYCFILDQALARTMPPNDPGGLDGTAEMNAFQAYCQTPPGADPSNRGDPHITTTNGVKYDFQAAGEFVALRNSATKFELQTRQTPVLTTFTPGPNPHTGLSSCVSLNTAVGIRVGKTEISYTPYRGGMELRINDKVVDIHQIGINLGGGNWIAGAPVGDGFIVQAADGTRVIVTPNFWASQGYSYLNIEVLDTPAREGIMGPILGTDWLPKAPGGASFGPKPAALPDRDVMLNQIFANKWRVSGDTSLFHYEGETSTGTFTETSWPPPTGSSCTEISPATHGRAVSRGAPYAAWIPSRRRRSAARSTTRTPTRRVSTT